MRIYRLIAVLVTAIAAVGLGPSSTPLQKQARRTQASPQSSFLSLIPLIANPQAFNGSRITVVGYLYIGRMPEDDSLWANRSDGDNSLWMNSLLLVLNPSQRSAFLCMSKSYAAVTGTFVATGPARGSLHAGTLVRISSVTGWSPYRPHGCAAGAK